MALCKRYKKTFSEAMIVKDISSENKVKKVVKKTVKNPLSQFMTLGVILILVSTLAQIGILPSTITDALSTTVIYAIIAIGFCLLMGYSGLASLGTAGFAGIGVYCAFFVMGKAHQDLLMAIIVAIIVALIMGLIIGFISLRIEGMYLAILTLGLAEILFEVFNNINNAPKIPYENNVFLGIFLDPNTKFIIFTVLYVILLCLTHNLINSPTGRAMLAMKNSTSAAQAMGISLLKYRLMAFVVSTIYAAIGGVLYMEVMYSGINLSGSNFLALAMSLNILGAVIVGGSKSLWGTSVGVLLIFGIQTLFLNRIDFFVENPEYMGLFSGLLLVIVVMFYPGGLYQLFYELKFKIRKLLKKRKDKKYGVN